MVKGLPSQYAFMPVTCNNIKCIHPLCQNGGREIQHTWFETGTPVSMFPLPVKDPERALGRTVPRMQWNMFPALS